MHGIVCPRCGRPTPVPLSSPESMRCEACSFAGPTPEPARSQLLAAQATLLRLDARERQISGAQRLAYDSHYERVLGSFWVLLVACAGFEGLATAASIANHGVEDWIGIAGPLAGLSACLFAGLVVLALLRGGRRAFERAHAATPPRVEGGEATCHVCGGPLGRPDGRSAVVRCRFCAADNLVAPEIVGRIAKSRSLVLEDHATAVGRSAGRFGVLATVVGLSLLWILPPLALGSHFGLKHLIAAIDDQITEELPPHPIDYALVGASACVHEVDGKGNVRGSTTGMQWRPYRGIERATVFRHPRLADELVSMTTKPNIIGPSVIRVYGRPAPRDNWALVRNRSGDTGRIPVASMCLVVPPYDLHAAP